MTPSIFAKNLRFLRKNNGWMQSEMEAKSGVRQRNWSNLENGVAEPDLTTLISISKLFGVSLDDILTVNLEENGNLNEKTGDKKSEINSNLNSNLNGNLLAEDEVKYKTKEQTDLLILKQLNYIADQVKKIDEKLDRHGN